MPKLFKVINGEPTLISETFPVKVGGVPTLIEKTITSNGEYFAEDDSADGYSSINVNVSSQDPTLQTKTATPTESQQIITPDSGYDGLEQVTVDAISSSYIGSSISRRTSSDVSVSGPTVSVPVGYYSSSVTKTVQETDLSTPTINVDSSGLITASITQSEGYIESGSKSNTSQLQTQAGSTITPTKSTQTAITSGKYTTGNISVGPIPAEYITTADANASANDILLNKTAYVNGSKITGNVVIQAYYTGSSDPSSSLGSNGDLYLKK